jgi:hypothetical protein
MPLKQSYAECVEGGVMTGLRSRDHGCRLCALDASQNEGPVPFDSCTTAYVGSDVIALARSDSEEVLIAPVCHVASLTGLAPGQMAELLATLRRVTVAVGSDVEGELRTLDLLGAPGHVCTRIPVRHREASAHFDPSSWVTTRLREVLRVGQ